MSGVTRRPTCHRTHIEFPVYSSTKRPRFARIPGLGKSQSSSPEVVRMNAATLTRPAPATLPAQQDRLSTRRLVSLDALRGFDMFWIIGGEDVVQSLSDL